LTAFRSNIELYFCRKAKHICGALCLTLSLTLIANFAIAANDPAISAEQRDEAGEPMAPIAFDVPAQPLASALETYGSISGLQVVYESGLARGRLSTMVKGTFTPVVALRMLLAGTGLSPRYMAADGFVLIPDPAARNTLQSTLSPLAETEYYGRIQAGLRQVFCTDERARLGGYRIAVSLWIGSSGTVRRSALLDSTGNTALDATLDQAIRDMNIGEAPPTGFTQPIIMIVTPDVMRDCLAAQIGVRKVKAEP
jgi:TonB family protein